jgi:hypothetical protein
MKNAKSPGGIGGGGVRPVRERRIVRTNHAQKILDRKKGLLTAKKEARSSSNAEERLGRNLFYLESSFCKAGGQGGWPPQWLLKEIKDDVLVLYGLERVRRPWTVWEAFERVDTRKKKLQLVARVNRLIGRARAVLPGESFLSKTVRAAIRGNAKAQCSLRDMVLTAGNPAELFCEYHQMEQEQCKREPLVCWLGEISHPMAKDFGIKIFETDEELKEEARREHKRDTNRERQRRLRLRKKIRLKSVTPGLTKYEG